MGGFPFRAETDRLVALARSTTCTCVGASSCLRCIADRLTPHLHLVRLPLLLAPLPEPPPEFLEHIAGPTITCLDYGGAPSLAPVVVERRQTCAECGAELERGGRGVHFWPAGTRLFALPGRHTIGPEIAFRVLRAPVSRCPEPTTSCGTVTAIEFGRMKLVALLRVSTRTQERDGYGLDSQEADIRAWARLHKHRIAYVVRETVPGDAAPNLRAGLCEAMQLVTLERADGIVVARLDRLARDLILQEQLIAEVDHIGGVLRSAAASEDENLIDNDPRRVLIRQILGAIAQYDRAMIRLRTRNGREVKAARGGYIGGAPPFGWEARGGQLVPLEIEQIARRRIKEWHRQGCSYRVIAAKLNAAGIPPKKAEVWSANSVRRIVLNVTRAVPAPERKAG